MFIARQPLVRLATRDEAVAVAVNLASDESVLTSGIAYLVDGGLTL